MCRFKVVVFVVAAVNGVDVVVFDVIGVGGGFKHRFGGLNSVTRLGDF